MPDVNISVGVDSGAVTTGMAAVRNTVQRTSHEISGMLAGAFTVGAVIAGIKSIIDKAEEIHHTAARFGIDAVQLQTLGNVAKQDGISMDQLARAMTLLRINAQTAIDPTTKQALAMERLGLSASKFAQLNPEDQILALADAYAKSSKDGEAFADVAELIGKRNTALIPFLEHGSAAILAQAKNWRTLGDAEVEQLHRLKIEEERYLASLQSWSAKVLVGWGYMFEGIKIHASNFMDWMRGTLTDESAAQKWEDLFLRAAGGPTQLKPPVKSSPGQFEEGGGTTGGGGAGSVGGGLADIQRRNRLAALSDEARINELYKQRDFLQDALNSGIEEGVLGEASQYDLKRKIAGVTAQIIPLEQQIADANAQQAEADLKAVNTIEEKIAASEHEVTLAQLIAAGRGDEAEALAIVLDYEEKIKKVLDDENEARQAGNDLIADENAKLAEQLRNEEAETLAAKQRAENEKVAKEGMTPTAPLTGFGPFYGGGGGYTVASTALGLATNPLTGEVDKDKYIKEQARAQIGALTGVEQFNFEERAIANRNLLAAAQRQTAGQVAQQKSQNAAAIEYLQGIISGRIHPEDQADYLQNYSLAYAQPLFPGMNLANMAATAPANDIQIQQLSTQIDLMQQQLDQLEALNVKLTPRPGGI
jgi:hypothetical protein